MLPLLIAVAAALLHAAGVHAIAPPILTAPAERQHFHGFPQLLFDDEHKIMCCYIQKNGCTLVAELFLKLAGRRHGGSVWGDLYKGGGGARKRPWSRTFDDDEITDAWYDDDFARIVQVRDPAERLLSGYLQKCLDRAQRSSHCIGFKNTGTPVPTFAEFINKLTPKKIRSNNHFRMQSDMCGLYNTSWRYNYIVDMSSNTFQSRIRDIYLSHDVSSNIVDSLYPPVQKQGSNSHNTAAHEKMKQYYGEDGMKDGLLDKVHELFRADYVLLSQLPTVNTSNWAFPLPKYAQQLQ